MKTALRKYSAFFISLVIFFATVPIRYQGFLVDIWITPFIFLIAVYISIRISPIKPSKILGLHILGFTTPYLLICLIEGFYLPFSIHITAYISAMIVGYLLHTKSNIYVKSLLFLPLIVFIYISNDFLFKKLQEYTSFGTFDGKVDMQVPENTGYITELNDTVNFDHINKNKIVLIDIWSTSCGNCFKQFPILQDIYDEYKLNPNVQVTAMNVPRPRDTVGQAAQMIRERNYTFPLSTPYNAFDTAMEVYRYPKTFVIHNDKVVFYGPLRLSKELIEELLANQ